MDLVEGSCKLMYLAIQEMGRLREEIKKEIRDEVEDIVYEKAKEEIKSKISEKYHEIKGKIFNFFGIKETQGDKIYRISEEIKKTQNPVLDDQVLGVIELFTLNYARTLVELMSSTVREEADKNKTA